MRFGGHETFAIREGWLHKGLVLLTKHSERMDDEYVADWLGVGRNMAKSIKHWLVATGLAERPLITGTRKRGPMQPTKLGRLVLANDPYFLEKGTWFALHINLVNNREHAATWSWYFNHFLNMRFERATCNESLRRYLAATETRLPSPKTLQRDVSCLLTSYAKDVPPSTMDPEDASDSPFRELGLLVHFRDSGSYSRAALTGMDVPPELVPYALVSASAELQHPDSVAQISVREACLLEGGPGRCFNMDLEEFHELCMKAQNELGQKIFKLISLAGERVIQLKGMTADDWLLHYYSSIVKSNAA